ncbi:hypothetical protein LCGC14_1218860 [marine sediment metagenome]|uniref:Uncharacterized protein n=1 Tax=marine sediment metagenome TaxID=412755 RepID=A0A0F9LFY7_9ZZZZ
MFKKTNQYTASSGVFYEEFFWFVLAITISIGTMFGLIKLAAYLLG